MCYKCGKLGSHNQYNCTVLRQEYPVTEMYPSSRKIAEQSKMIQRRGHGRGCVFDFGGNRSGPSISRGRGTGGGRVCTGTLNIGGKQIQAYFIDENQNTDIQMMDVKQTGKLKIYFTNISQKSCGEEDVKFISDSGAAEHIVNKFKWLKNPKRIVGIVRCANKNSSANLKIDYSGELLWRGERNNTICLKNMLYAPELA